MKKRFLIGIICLALFCASFTGCGKKEETVSEDVNSFTYWCAVPSAVASVFSDMNEIEMYKEYEKKSGVHINFIHPVGGQQAEQFNLMIATDDLPDMVEYNWHSYSGGVSKAISDKVIVPLNDYIDEYAPNFKKWVTNGDDYEKQSKTDEGYYYGFPEINTGDYRVFGGLMVRGDWLDELNLPVPETIDEWETMLRAFKEKKGATAPFVANSDMFSVKATKYTFSGAFGVGLGLYLDGKGNVKFSPVEPAYKEYITRMNKWYKEGLLDRDYETNNAAGIDAKILSGESGALYAFIGSAQGRYLKAMEEKDPKYSLVGVPFLVENKGDATKFAYASAAAATSSTLAITTSCKNVAKAVEWADFWYSDEGHKLMNFGVEGLSYNMVDGLPVYTDEILNHPEGISINEAMSRHFRVTAPAPGLKQDPEYLRQYYQYSEQRDAIELWGPVADSIKNYIMPAVTTTAEENDILASLETEISTYVDETVAKFVNGKEPLGKFDAFVDKLYEIGVEKYIEIYQSAYDRYKDR